MDKNLIIGLIAGLVIGGIAGYILNGVMNKPNYMRDNNLQLNEEQIGEVTAVFQGTAEEIESYCQDNMMNCGFYCRQINQDHEYCSNYANPGGFRG